MYPVIAKFWGAEIPSYGFFLMLGLFSGLISLALLLKKENFEDFVDIALFTLVFSFLGARGIPLWLNWSTSLGLSQIFTFHHGGFSFFGGFLSGFPAFFFILKRKHMDFWQTSDLVTGPLGISMAVIKLGCLGAGCCYGVATKLPIGIRIYSEAVEAKLRGIPLYPTQVVDFLFFTLASILFWYFLPKKILPKGGMTLLASFLTIIMRFLMEFIRGDREPGVLTSLSLIQEIIILLFFLGGFISIYWAKSLNSQK